MSMALDPRPLERTGVCSSRRRLRSRLERGRLPLSSDSMSSSIVALALSRDGIAGVCGVCGDMALPGGDDVETDAPTSVGGMPDN